jgi:hypothetical protein
LIAPAAMAESISFQFGGDRLPDGFAALLAEPEAAP